MFLEDHEFNAFDDGGDKVFFHLIRACACVLGVELVFNGSKDTKEMYMNRTKIVLNDAMNGFF